MQRWEPGTVIMWRYGDGFAEPMTVVQDDDEGLVAWLRAGTPTRKLVRADGRTLRAEAATMFTADRVEVDGVWEDHDVLRIAPTNAWWSVWVFFDPVTHDFQGWYVNIEDPHVRSDHAVHTRDHVLDLWVEPDRSCSRKDEDELVLAVEQGRYNREEAELITTVAEQVEKVIADWGSPFCDGWEDFRPDPDWPVPVRA